MAITIKQTPQLVMPVGNPIVFTVDSTNKVNCNFQYIADIYVNGSYITRLELFPTGVNGYASFNIKRILTDFVSHDLHPALYGSTGNVNSICNYFIRFGEQYDTSVACDAGVTTFPNLTSSSVYYAFNGALQYKEWTQYDYTKFVTNATTKRFLTNMPNNTMIQFNDELNFNFFNMTTNTIPTIEVKTYDDTNALIDTFQFANSNATLSTLANRLVSIGVGPHNLNNTTLTLGTQPVIDPTVKYYTITLVDVSSNPISETKKLQIDTRVNKWEPKRLWFLNRLGAFDAYTYTLVSNRNLSVTNAMYNKLNGSYRALSPTSTWTYDIGDRGRTVLNVQAQESMTFTSNWLTEPEALWMEELFTTPELYLCYPASCPTETILSFNQMTCDIVHDASGFISFYLANTNGLNPGDIIYVDFDDPSLIDGSYTILSIEDGFVTIEYACDTGYAITTGTVTILSNTTYTNELTPYVRTSASWTEKLKRNIRNINYQIEVQPAYSVNIQRN